MTNINDATPVSAQTPSLVSTNGQTLLRYGLVMLGMWLINHKVIQSDALNNFVAFGLIVVPILWAFLVNHWTVLREEVNKIIAVQAGINSTGITTKTSVNTADPQVKLATAAILEQHAPVPVKTSTR